MSDLKFKTAEPLDAWVAAALQDGWSPKEAIYGPNEDIERAFRIRRDGFVVRVLRREVGHPQQPAWMKVNDYNLCAWSPTGEGIDLPEVYDFEKIKAAATVCDGCGKSTQVVHRVAFANKSCESCLPAMRKKHEYPGWAN